MLIGEFKKIEKEEMSIKNLADIQFPYLKISKVFFLPRCNYIVRDAKNAALFMSIVLVKNVTALRTELGRMRRVFRLPTALVAFVKRGT